MTPKLILLAFSLYFMVEKTYGQRIVREPYQVSGATNFYYMIRPEGSIKGILLLFPGRGEKPKKVFSSTALPGILKEQGYLTIVPELPYALFADETIKNHLDQILSTYFGNTETSVPGLTIGGFSSGGTVALNYTEYLLSMGASYLQNVFVIDSPLDLNRLYDSSERLIKYDCGDQVHDEGHRTLSFLHLVLGGAPEEFPENYASQSPFTAQHPDGGNAAWLKSIPIRLYTEPDLDFVRKKYCQEMVRGDLNIVDLERLNQFLSSSGNEQVELIITEDRGYHSWNIIDPINLAHWIANSKKSP